MTARFATDSLTRPLAAADPATGRVRQRNMSRQLAGAAFRGSAKIRAMAATPSYAAPTMTTPPTFAQSVGALAQNTKNISYTSTIFRWAGPVNTASGSAIPRHYSRLDGFQAASVPASSVAFDFDGDQLDFIVKANSTLRWRVWVNEQAHAATMQTMPSSTGAQAYINIAFGSTAIGTPRRIVIELEDPTNQINFYGLRTTPAFTVFPPSIASPRVMIVGDSYGLGLGATNYCDGYSRALGRLMGWADTWGSFTSVPSTGLVANGSATAGYYGSRLAGDVLPYSPDILIIQGSLNDNPFVGRGLIGPALTNYVQQVQNAYPDCLVVATGPLFVAAPQTSYTQVRDEMAAAAATLGIPFIDLFAPVLYFTGTGNATTPNATGNADYYRASDNTHPVSAGHYVLAKILASLLGPIVGQYE